MTSKFKYTIAQLIKQRKGINDNFCRLNPDKRLTLAHWGVSDHTNWCTIRIKFCGKQYFRPVIHLEEKDELAIDLIYFAHYMNQKRFLSSDVKLMPTYEVRLNTLAKDKLTASLRVDGTWKRIPFKLGQLLVSYAGLIVSDSNREAYMSDMSYVDWFQLSWNHEYYEGLLEDYDIPSKREELFA